MTRVIGVLVLLLVYYHQVSLGLKCYECTGYVPCGNGQTHLLVNCPGKCMVYQNQYDGGMIIRRCCYSNCGAVGTSMYEGRYAYFCSKDMCNGATADNNLIDGGIIEEGSGDEIESTPPATTSSTSISLVVTSSSSSSLSCHECTGHYSRCGISQDTIQRNCRMCMVYLNAFDGNTVVRRCCTWGCGTSNSVSMYEGRQTYFCSSNLCNGIGSEKALTGARGQYMAGDAFPEN